jgi:stage II sporulation protein D
MTSKKGALFLFLMLLLTMILIPLVSLGGGSSAGNSSGNGISEDFSPPPSASGRQFRIRDTATGKILIVNDADFVRGTVACEMSPDAPPEALKAQAVAAYTYYSRIREMKRKQGSSSDFDATPSNWNIYASDDEMKKRWGSSYQKYSDTLKAASNAVTGQVLEYGGSLIDATYFATSGGSTEDAADVWGSKCPYLISVASPWDAYAGGYQTTASFPDDDFRSRIQKAIPSASFSGDAGGWVGSADRSPAGTVKAISVGGKTVTGSQVRQAFDLRSADFTVSHTDGKFTFTVKGYGHGVGMSQTGAEGMARQGAGYKEILAWYYPGTKIVSL